MLQNAPAEVTEQVLTFCEEIASESKPVYLSVEPLPYAIINECYTNVDRYIQAHGGTVQYGWQIWEWPKVMIEAEFHAVWVSPEGQYKDVTPKPRGINRVLFLPDHVRRYQGRQINNIRKALKDTQSIKDYIDSFDRMFSLMNEGDLAEQHGEVLLTPAQAIAIQEEQQTGQLAFLRILKEEGIDLKDVLAK